MIYLVSFLWIENRFIIIRILRIAPLINQWKINFKMVVMVLNWVFCQIFHVEFICLNWMNALKNIHDLFHRMKLFSIYQYYLPSLSHICMHHVDIWLMSFCLLIIHLYNNCKLTKLFNFAVVNEFSFKMEIRIETKLIF